MTLTADTPARVLRNHSVDLHDDAWCAAMQCEDLRCPCCCHGYALYHVLGEGPNTSVKPGVFQRWYEALPPGMIAGATLLIGWAIWMWLHI